MKGDFSRLTFDPKKRYSGVLMQQGRVQLDADWNEQQAIHQNRTEALARDAIGPSGAPKEDGGFAITRTSDKKNLRISSGRFYVDGILCENDGDVALTAQPDLPDLALPSSPGVYALYLDVWERHLTTLDDPGILESALGGPDTTTRTKTVWQVRYQAVDPDEFGPDWKPRAGGGMMNARAPVHSANGFLLPPGAGYTRLENQLYRVEIHRGGPVGTATFKWSRDNGSVASRIENVSANVVTVADVGRDVISGFADDQWVEVLEDGTELDRQRGELARIADVNEAERKVTLSGGPANAARLNDPTRHPKLRRWDQPKDSPPGGVATLAEDGSGWLHLEGGIEVMFLAEDEQGNELDYKSGDYWLIPARATSSTIEWPSSPGTNDPVFRPPHGTPHHHAALALVELDDAGTFAVPSDLRKTFPAATAITAGDVGFDNGTSGLPPGTDDAQAALDALARRRNNIFTYVVTPTEGWERVFDQIGEGEDAHVGFQTGVYTLDGGPISLRNKGNLTISGCGPGTRIQAPHAESVFAFEECESVILRDLSLASGTTGPGFEHLNGTVDFVRCDSVTLEGVTARSAGGAIRAASCVTVREAGGSVRIRGCDLVVGHQQVGLLLVGVEISHVEDNLLRAGPSPGDPSLEDLVRTSAEYRAKMRRLLVSQPRLGAQTPASDVANVTYGGYTVSFKTDPRLVFQQAPFPFPRFPIPRFDFLERIPVPRFPSVELGPATMPSRGLTSEWQQLVTRFPPTEQPASAKDLLAYVKGLADRILLDDSALVDPMGSSGRLASWRAITFAQHPTLASQGIVVAGRDAVRDVRILNNDIRNVVQGIHLGPCPGSRTHISGNTVEVLLSPPETSSERHGIFAADSGSLIVENNRVIVYRFESTGGTAIEGIRVYGRLGPVMTVRQNHLVGCTTGILFRPVQPDAGSEVLWLVAENVAPGTVNTVDAPDARVRNRDNVPAPNPP